MKKFYAGIGSRQITTEIETLMIRVAQKLDMEGWTLRSGGAKGSDKAFERGSLHKEIFKSNDAQPWAFEEVKKHIPTDRSGFDSWQPYVKGLLARNIMQVRGRNGDEPVSFVICWTPSTVYTDSSAGGTGYAIRCALAYGIRVYNLKESDDLELIRSYLNGKYQLA